MFKREQFSNTTLTILHTLYYIKFKNWLSITGEARNGVKIKIISVYFLPWQVLLERKCNLWH